MTMDRSAAGLLVLLRSAGLELLPATAGLVTEAPSHAADPVCLLVLVIPFAVIAAAATAAVVAAAAVPTATAAAAAAAGEEATQLSSTMVQRSFDMLFSCQLCQ